MKTIERYRFGKHRHEKPNLLRKSFAVCRSFALAMALGFTSFASAQLEPCGLFEVDGQPGYGVQDLYFTLSRWHQQGSLPAVPDFTGNGWVDVRDAIRQSACVGDLNHGLIGKYYGFEDGSPGQSISFPNFDALPANVEPVVVRPTELFEVLTGFRGFMDSELRHQFGAVYEGYLWVPETASYTLHIFGTQGMRVILDDTQILDFDGSPRADTTTMALNYGLHPIKIEFYTHGSNARILFDWTSNGTIITGPSQTILPQYFYHATTPVPQDAVTDLELLFYPPSGSQVDNVSTIQVQAFALSADADIDMTMDGQPQVLKEGWFTKTLNLQPGLNEFEFIATDSEGRTATRKYHIYRDDENLPSNGLVATLYATEGYELIPDVTGLKPYDVVITPSTQIERNLDGTVTIGGRYLGRGTVLKLEGTVYVNTANTYSFRIDRQATVSVNGEFINGIWAQFNRQYDSEGEIFLERGRHHYEVWVYDAWNGPTLNVWWREDGGPETLIPNNALRYGPGYLPAQGTPSAQASGGRVASSQRAEYIFKPGQTFSDTSGNGFDLTPDPRAIQRPGGGVTYQTGGSMVTEKGGVQILSEISKTRNFSLEVDFIYDKPVNDWNQRELISLTPVNWGELAMLSIHNDNLRFRINADNSVSEEVWADNYIVPGQRLHVVASYNGSTMRIFVNGVQAVSANYNLTFNTWETMGRLNVAQGYNRHDGISNYDQAVYGTILVAACYAKALSTTEINTNRNANLALNPSPGALAAPAVVDFPPPGTSQAELDEAFHVLNRLTFGPTPDSLAEILASGVDAWIAQQLNPAAIDDSALQTMLDADYFRPREWRRDLQALSLFRMAYSKRQMLEVIAQFWENHFNTQIDKVDDPVQEFAENQRYRSLAFGNFKDLLTACTMNLPMTLYLDNVSNVVGAPNENFGREFFELFSMGVNNGYTQDDIVAAARCFTGLSVRDGNFFFNPGLHDYGAKQVLGLNIPAGGGLSDVRMLIEHTVQRPEVADFISWKLVQLLVDDAPPNGIWTAASNTFQATSGDITAVLQTILGHADFRTNLNYRANKVKTPLEFLTSAVRITESFPMALTMLDYLDNMGMSLFNKAEPTGFAEEGVAWIDTNSLLSRWNVINGISTNRGNAMNVGMNFTQFVQKRGLVGYNALLDFFSDITTHGLEPASIRNITESWLTDDSPGSFVLTDSVLNLQARQTFSLYLRLPEFNKQ